jgi:AraC-like DNA-binding protein
VSSQYLSALFHRETGQSFSSFLIEQRIIKAKELLEGTDLPIIEISSEVGYTSEKHFYVMFKKNVGISPAKYRQIKRYENVKNSNNLIGGNYVEDTKQPGKNRADRMWKPLQHNL